MKPRAHRKRLLVAVVGLLGFSGISCADDLCSFKNTNQLVGDTGFKAELKKFFGESQGDLILPKTPLFNQVLVGLGGPPDDIRISGALAIASACRAHSCDEKAAVVIKCPSTIIAAGTLSFHCRERSGVSCETHRTLDLYFKDGDQALSGRSLLECWGEGFGDAPPIEYRTQSNLALHPDGPANRGTGG